MCRVQRGLADDSLIARRFIREAVLPSNPTAPATAAADIGADGLTVRPKATLGFDAPVRRRLIWIIKRRLGGVHHSRNIHAFRPYLRAMESDGNLWRPQRFHG